MTGAYFLSLVKQGLRMSNIPRIYVLMARRFKRETGFDSAQFRCMHMCILYRNRYRNLWDRQCDSSWWPLDWFGYLHELYIDIWFAFKSLTDGVCHLSYLYWLVGKGVAYGGLPLPGIGCAVPDVANIYLKWKTYYMGYCFCNCPHP